MDVTNFIGDFPTIEDLQNCKDIKAGDSAYVVKGGISTLLSLQQQE